MPRPSPQPAAAARSPLGTGQKWAWEELGLEEGTAGAEPRCGAVSGSPILCSRRTAIIRAPLLASLTWEKQLALVAKRREKKRRQRRMCIEFKWESVNKTRSRLRRPQMSGARSQRTPGTTAAPVQSHAGSETLRRQHRSSAVCMRGGEKAKPMLGVLGIRLEAFRSKVGSVQHLGAIPVRVGSCRQARGPSGLAGAPAVPNANIWGCLRSSAPAPAPGAHGGFGQGWQRAAGDLECGCSVSQETWKTPLGKCSPQLSTRLCTQSVFGRWRPGASKRAIQACRGK